MQKAVAKRGLSMHDIACGPDDPGWWGKEWEDGKRLARLACYKTKGTPNYHMQPVEGIDAGMASHTSQPDFHN